MKQDLEDLLGRSATEYGLYFMLFPLGYCAGNLVSSRLSGKVAIITGAGGGLAVEEARGLEGQQDRLLDGERRAAAGPSRPGDDE